ncbi:tail fiber domain-containing protein [Salmonella enterica subsp. enterica serovar Saintpaul]|nr:tail fiber domain-containing protein [Salmonella enterica subsp. enterica serovar Saintpaul]
MPIDENTPRIALEKPNKSNSLAHDVERLRDALVKLDNVTALVERVPGEPLDSLRRQLRQDQIPANIPLKDDQGKISNDVLSDDIPRLETITENGKTRRVLKEENIPPEALNRIFTVDSEVAMLALKHPEDVTIGDVVQISNSSSRYMLMGVDPSQRTNWMVQAPWSADVDRYGVNTNITELRGLSTPVTAPVAQNEDQLVTLRQARSLLTANTSSATLNGVMNNFIGAVEWWNGSRDNLPAGYVLADGQVLSRLKYPDVATAIDKGMFTSMPDALWITDSLGGVSNRAAYSKGGAAGTDPTKSTPDPWFRVPDLNGKQLNSIPNLFLMGWNGVKINNLYSAGAALSQGAPNITGSFKVRVPNGHANEATGAVRGASGLQGLNGNVPVGYTLASGSADYIDTAGYGYTFNAQLGAELYSAQGFNQYRTYGAYIDGALRPNNALGYWIIRVSGSFVAADTIFECRNQFDSSAVQVGDPLATGHLQGSLLDSDGKVVNAVGMNAGNTVGSSPVAHFGVANWDSATNSLKWKSIDLAYSTGRTTTPGDMFATPNIKSIISGGQTAQVTQGVIGVQAAAEPNSIVLMNQLAGTHGVVNSLKGSWYTASYELFATRTDNKNLERTVWRFTPYDGQAGTYREISIYADGNVTLPGGQSLDGTGGISAGGLASFGTLRTNGRADIGNDLVAKGAIYMNGSTIVAASDRTLKTDVAPICNALDKLDAIQGYTYAYKKDGMRSAGVIAQEVQSVLPDAVMTLPDTDHLGVAYNGVIALLVAAMKELKAEVAALKAKA